MPQLFPALRLPLHVGGMRSSGKEMAVYLRDDSHPDEVVFIYVCHDSKTYFLKTIASAID